MLNDVCLMRLTTIDYKSIALPAELQGRQIVLAIFSRKDQLNQSKKNYRLKIYV